MRVNNESIKPVLTNTENRVENVGKGKIAAYSDATVQPRDMQASTIKQAQEISRFSEPRPMRRNLALTRLPRYNKASRTELSKSTIHQLAADIMGKTP